MFHWQRLTTILGLAMLSAVRAANLVAYSTSVEVSTQVTADFTVLPDEEAVEMTVTYQGTGWLGIGAGITMVGSKACIAKGDGTDPMIYDLKGFAASAIELAATQNLLDKSYAQDGTTSVLMCKVPIDLPEGQLAFSSSNETPFIVAWGDEFRLGHTGRRKLVLPALQPSSGETADGNVPDGSEPDDTEPDVAEPDVVEPEATDGPVELRAGLTLNMTDNGDRTVTYELTYEGEAWVSLAVSPNGRMVGAQAVIGLPAAEEDPLIWNMNERSDSGVVVAEKQILTSSSVSQRDGITILTFTVPIDTDGFRVSPVGETGYLYAYGTSNTLGYHDEREPFSLSIDGFASFADDPTKYYKAHGILMAIAWGVLCPLAIGASMLRSLFPPGMFFQIHRALNSLVVLLTVVAFALAVRATNIENLDHFTSEVNHRIIGMVIFILAVFQVVNGALRPHLPEKATAEDNEHKGHNTQDGTKKTEEVNQTDGEKSILRKMWEVGHRLFGAVILALAWVNCSSGIERYLLKFGDTDDETTWKVIFWVITGAISGLILAIFAFQKAMASS